MSFDAFSIRTQSDDRLITYPVWSDARIHDIIQSLNKLHRNEPYTIIGYQPEGRITMSDQIHTYVYLQEGAIHIKDMSIEEYQAAFDNLHSLNHWSSIKQNHQMITDSTNEIARRAKLQVIDHRRGVS